MKEINLSNKTQMQQSTVVTNIESLIPTLSSAIDVTEMVESMFDTSRIMHELAQSDIDAVDICRSYAFDPTPLNWAHSQSDNWLKEYATANFHRNYYKNNGLVSTLAFDYLGKTNYKCTIGTSYLCQVDCPTVVRAISDLEVARKVYFILSSASNMLTVTEILHKNMESSQNNLHDMIGRMHMDFFFTKHPAGEVTRGKTWTFLVQVVVWAVQNIITSFIPSVPWHTVQAFCAGTTVAIMHKDKSKLKVNQANQVPMAQVANAIMEMAVGTVIRPTGSADTDEIDDGPDYRALFDDWIHIDNKFSSRWSRAFSNTSNEPTWLSGLARTAGTAWKNLSNATFGIVQKIGSKWWMNRNGDVEPNQDTPQEINNLPNPPLPPLVPILGPVDNNIAANIPLPISRANSVIDEFDAIPEGATIQPAGDNSGITTPFYHLGPGDVLVEIHHRGGIYQLPKSEYDKIGNYFSSFGRTIQTIMPVGLNLAMPMALRDAFDNCLWAGSDMGAEYNNAQMKWMIQETGRYARRMLKDNVNRIFMSEDVTADGKKIYHVYQYNKY